MSISIPKKTKVVPMPSVEAGVDAVYYESLRMWKEAADHWLVAARKSTASGGRAQYQKQYDQCRAWMRTPPPDDFVPTGSR